MPTVRQYIKQLRTLYKLNDVIAVHLWQVDDVIGKADELDIKLGKQDAEEIIECIHNHIDSEYGITWDTLASTITDFTFHCEDCKKEFGDFYEYKDDQDGSQICEDCYNKRFAKAVEEKDKEWFTDNYNDPIKEYPKLKFLQEDKDEK